MRQIDEATSVGEADDVPVEEPAALKPKIKPTPAVPTTEVPTLDPKIGALPGLQPVPSAPPPVTETATPFSGVQSTAMTPPPAVPSVPVPAAAPPPALPAVAPAPIQTMTGDWTPPVASAQSAPLIATQAGGTMTPQGDAANSFRGYETDQGGKFGGYDSAVNPQTGVTMKQFDKTIADKLAGMNLNFSDINANDLNALSKGSPTGQVADTDALRMKLFQGGQLTPAEQYALMYESGKTPQLYRPEWNADGSLKGWNQSANDMQAVSGFNNLKDWNAEVAKREATAKQATDRRALEDRVLGTTFVPGVGSARVEGESGNIVNPATGQVIGNLNDPNLNFDALKKAMGSSGNFTMSANGQAVPTSSLPQSGPVARPVNNWTAADPAEQQRLLEQMKRGAIPSGPTGESAVAMPGKVANVPASTVPSDVTGGYDPRTVGNVPVPPSGTGASGLPGVGPAPSTAFTTKPTDPNNPLTSQTIDFGDLADRFKVAQSELENWNKTSDPQFQADLRDAMRKAAAGGALGSGMLQTSLGDITANRELQRQGMGTSFLNNALTGSIQDAKDRAALAERQQGFQADQQRTAFGQGVTEAQLNEALTNGAFQRALQQLVAGSNGNPADIQLALSSIFGNQGANASNALGGLIQNKTANTGNTANTSYLAQLLAALQGAGGGTASSTGGPGYVNPMEG